MEKVINTDEAVNFSDSETEKTLSDFTPYNGTFAERLAEFYFSDRQVERKLSEQPYDDSEYEDGEGGRRFYGLNGPFSDNGYTPSINDAYGWARDIVKALNLNMDSEQWMRELPSVIGYVAGKLAAGEINAEDARKIAAIEFERLEWGIERIAFQGGPRSEEWHASQMINSFGTLYSSLRYAEEDAADPEEAKSFYSSLEEEIEDIRRNFMDCSQEAFKIGFLYRDAWWKFQHEKAALKYYEIIEKNRASGQKGGQGDKKRERYEVLNRLARQKFREIAFASDKEGARLAKNLAATYDANADEPLFMISSKGLSKRWYDDWLVNFRQIARSIV